MIYYILCVISSFLTALAFASKKKYQDSSKTGIAPAFAFIAAYAAIAACILVIISKFNFQFSPVGFGIALAGGLIIVVAQAIGFLCMLYGSMLGMSMFASIGATVIPCIAGMAIPIFGEDFSYFKLIGTALLVISLSLPAIFAKGENVKNKFKYYVSCILLFLINGSSPLMGKLKTVIADDISDSMYQFYAMLAVCFYSLILTAVFKAAEKKKAPAAEPSKVPANTGAQRHSWIYAVIFAIFACIADYLSLVALGGIGVSLQSPITMGLSVIFTAVVGLIFFRERITKTTALSIAVAVAGISVISL